jgi:hypothetical protein
MALPAVIKSLSEVPEALQGEYKPVGDGTFALDVNVEDHPGVRGLKSSLINVREELRGTKDGLAKFKDVDPEKYKVMLTHEQQILEGQLIAAGKVDELTELRTKALRESLQGELGNERTKVTALETQLNKLVIDNAVQTAAAKHGVKPSAMEDVLFRARATFQVRDGVAVAMEGNNIKYGKTGTDPLGIDEWMSNLPAVAGHLFNESKGGGATGGQQQNKGTSAPGTISRNDQMGILNNLDAIAKGKIKVI